MTGSVHVSFSDGRLFTQVIIHGTGDIGWIDIFEDSPGAQPGDAQATALAFVSLAQRLGCTVGSLGQEGDDFRARFVCEGLRDKLISVIGDLARFSLTPLNP